MSVPLIPEMKVGLIVVTPSPIINITKNKKYVVEKIGNGMIVIRNDNGELASYNAYEFIEVDLYFTMCLFATVITLFKLGNKAFK